MDVTNLPLKPSLLEQLQHEHPQYTFKQGDHFRWAPDEKCIYFCRAALRSPEGQWEILHELAHAQLQHQAYRRDINLIEMEAQAWSYACDNSQTYGIVIDEAYAQECVGSYRTWLHERSTCPQCMQTGLQTQKDTYSCINCGCLWRVNDAKFCLLRRSVLS